MNTKNLIITLFFLALAAQFARAEFLNISTNDGLTLGVDSANSSLQQIEIEHRFLSTQNTQSGFLFYDAGSPSSSVTPRINQFASLAGTATKNGNVITQVASSSNLRLDVAYEARERYVQVTGTLTETNGADRAIILAYAQRFDSTDARVWSNARNSVTVPSGVARADTVSKWGAEMRYSEYPVSTIASLRRGLSYAVDRSVPAVSRFEYDADADSYYILYDFGLSSRTRSPSSASFSFIIYRADPVFGFRDAAKKYYSFFPAFAQERFADEGNCLTHNTRLLVEDLGGGAAGRQNLAAFRFKFNTPFPEWFNSEAYPSNFNIVNGINLPLGINTVPFFISQPGHSMGMDPDAFHTAFGYNSGLDNLGEWESAQSIFTTRLQNFLANPSNRVRENQINNSLYSSNFSGINATLFGADRQVFVPNSFYYGSGVDVASNFEPDFPDSSNTPALANLNYSNFANLMMYENAQYVLGTGITNDGIGILPYFDFWSARNVNINGGNIDVLWFFESPQGHDLSHYNCRTAQYATTDAPLAFETPTYYNPSARRPCIYNPFSYQEFLKRLRQEFDAKGKLLTVNDYGTFSGIFAPYFDVYTIEMHDITPPDNEQNNYRFYSYHKPVCTYFNPDDPPGQGNPYASITHEQMETYIKTSLFYGIYPSAFESHDEEGNRTYSYWLTKSLYNDRDGDLWRFYLPLVIELNTAGWEPNTWAVTDNANVYVERFGPTGDGRVYFTVRNKAASTQAYRLKIALTALGMATPTAAVTEMISGTPFSSFTRTPTNSGIITDTLNAGDVKVFKITR